MSIPMLALLLSGFVLVTLVVLLATDGLWPFNKLREINTLNESCDDLAKEVRKVIKERLEKGD